MRKRTETRQYSHSKSTRLVSHSLMFGLTLSRRFMDYAQKEGRWILPALRIVTVDLRQLASLAHQQSMDSGDKKFDALEDAARVCNKAFRICLLDR